MAEVPALHQLHQHAGGVKGWLGEAARHQAGGQQAGQRLQVGGVGPGQEKLHSLLDLLQGSRLEQRPPGGDILIFL